MGCVSSKFVKKQELGFSNGGDYVNHVVSLTSSTYGALKLEKDVNPIRDCVSDLKGSEKAPPRDQPEVINAWELMEDLEEGLPISNRQKKSPKSNIFRRGFFDVEGRSPLKFLNQFGSPMKVKRFGGKENTTPINGPRGRMRRLEYNSPKEVLKSKNSSPNSYNSVLNFGLLVKGSPIGGKRNNFYGDSISGYSYLRRSPTPLFDPELVASYEKELSEEEEHIKRMVSPRASVTRIVRFSQESESFLGLFEKKCPPGGENSVVIYTTTLRGIRKTFEDCNVVRSIIESHRVHMFERDVSMDSGFKEELRRLMGTKGIKVPLVFVKGRLIGGAEEMFKLEEEGKLDLLFDGLPTALGSGCEGCAGVRFMMCMECNGSCKVLDDEQNISVRCGECNENGLIQCPVCC